MLSLEMFRGRLWYRMALLLKLTIQIRCCKRFMADSDSFQLAMTGNAYNVLQEEGLYINRLIETVLVYARMSPDQKQDLVQRIMDNGKIVGMVGDGGN